MSQIVSRNEYAFGLVQDVRWNWHFRRSGLINNDNCDIKRDSEYSDARTYRQSRYDLAYDTKATPSGSSRLREIENSRARQIKFLLTALGRDSRSSQVYVRRGSIMRECTLTVSGSINDSSQLWSAVRARPFTCLHTQGMKIFKGALSPHNFSPFSVRRCDAWATRVTLTGVFFQGPIGLDGPKGDSVSSA